MSTEHFLPQQKTAPRNAGTPDKTRRHLAIATGEKDLSAALLGGKGRSLVEMKRLGIPVPPGFTISTTAARAFMEHGHLPSRLGPQMLREIRKLEGETGKRFGDPQNPLLVSVRSGAEISMPGMMDTVLNLGLNPDTVTGLAKQTGSEKFAYDCYRRFLTMFGSVVLNIEREEFERLLAQMKESRGIRVDSDVPAEDLRTLCETYRDVICRHTGLSTPPDDPLEQLAMATVAVFQSWNNDRAKLYREAHLIPDSKGTAVTVQAMVFGNRGEDSGTGVVFSSNVSTGEPGLYGEFLSNAQGEDVVAGIRTPLPISRMREWNPKIHTELQAIVEKLEGLYGDTVDVEFTVERGVLYILQSRTAKSTLEARAKTLFRKTRNMKDPKKRASIILETLPLESLESASQPSFSKAALLEAEERLLSQGLPVSPGVAVGKAVLSSKRAQELSKNGEHVILVRPDTSPDDLPGMMAASAIVTETGGATSHAAVVARGMNKPAVAGAPFLRVLEGEIISVDGGSGKVYRGALPITTAELTKELMLLGKWAREHGKLGGANAPRLALERIDAHASYNVLCNDFYLSDAMALAARGTPLASETSALKRKIHEQAARDIATYLTLSVAGELRHQSCVRYPDTTTPYGKTSEERLSAKQAKDILWKKFGMADNEDEERHRTQDVVAMNLERMSIKDQIQFLDLAQTVFQDGIWTSGFGGKAWAGIAQATKEYLSGKTGTTAFVDHAFDLEHNGGSVFGKRDSMLFGDVYALKAQLEAKKHAKGVEELWQKLKNRHAGVSNDVRSLFERGVQIGIWK